MRNTTRKYLLGMTLVAGLMGMGAATANAAPLEFRGHFDRPIVRREFARPIGRPFIGGIGVDTYIPPCPGDGYDWVAGYYDSGIWVPGAWTFRAGYRGEAYRGGDRGYAYGRGFRDDHRGYAPRAEAGRFDRGVRGRR
jgi:hypothetical protein